MPWTTTGANDVVGLLLAATALNGAYSTSLYVSAHTAAPGASGTQTTSEISYTGYGRAALTRQSSGQFTVTNNVGTNNALIDWGTYTAGTGGTITHWGLGTASTSTGRLAFWGTVTPNLVVTANPHHPTIPISALTITLPTT